MTVDEFIAEAAPSSRLLLQSLRELIRGAHPMIEEKMRYRIPFYDYKGMLFFLNPRKDTIELGICNGAKLYDEDGILSATDRKIIRHLVITSLKDTRKPEVRAILQQAIMVRELEEKKVNKNKVK